MQIELESACVEHVYIPIRISWKLTMKYSVRSPAFGYVLPETEACESPYKFFSNLSWRIGRLLAVYWYSSRGSGIALGKEKLIKKDKEKI